MASGDLTSSGLAFGQSGRPAMEPTRRGGAGVGVGVAGACANAVVAKATTANAAMRLTCFIHGSLRDIDTLLPGGRLCAGEGVGITKFEVFTLAAGLFAKGVEVAAQSKGDADIDGFVVFFAGASESKGATAKLGELFEALNDVGIGAVVAVGGKGDLCCLRIECDGHEFADGLGGSVIIDVVEM